MNRTPKRPSLWLATLGALVLALGLCFGLTACGGGEEGAAIRAVTTRLDKLADATDDEAKSALGDDLSSKLKDAGIDPVAFYKALVAHFSYEEPTAEVDGDSATVKLKTTNVDVDSVLSAWQTSYLEWAGSDEGKKADEAAVNKKVYSLLLEKLTADDVATKTADVSLGLSKTDGEWKPTDNSQVSTVIFAGQDLASTVSPSS